jgi:hypoxanthine phosphoribosyltransferase
MMWSMVEREILTWERYGHAARQLAQLVADDGYRPDIILSIARGGLVAAGSLSYALDVKNVHVMNVMFYTGVDERLDMPIVLPPVPSALDLKDTRVLIADDVADTGETLKLAREICAEHVAEARCAVLYEKPHSVVRCEYVWARTDRWIEFPWSIEPPIPRPRTAQPSTDQAAPA